MPTTLVRPDIIFEANFFNTTDGQAWTNLSSYVELDRGIDVSMRRQQVFDDVSAGSFSIHLDNTLGTFNNNGTTPVPFAFVRQAAGSFTTAQNNSPQVTISTATGNHLVAIFTRSGGSGTGALTSVTDSAGNTWVFGTSGAVSGLSNTRIEIWYSLNANAVTWVQGNSGTSQTWAWNVQEYSGSSSVSVDVVSPALSSSASGITISTPAISTSGSSDLVVAACHMPQTTATLVAGSFTALTSFDDGTAGSGRAAYIVNAGAGSYSASWTQGLSQQAGVLAIAFKGAGATTPYAGLINIDVPIRLRVRWPRVPTDTPNMLSSDEAAATTPDAFNAEQGSLDLETTSVPTGQSTALLWSTGVLQTLNNRVQIGDFNSRSADDFPVYVSGSTQYTFSASFKTDASGTGITFQIAPCIQWYDNTGQFISESVGTTTTLTTAYARLSVTATSPAGAYTARMGMMNKTLVNPATAAIAPTGFTNDAVFKGGRFTHLRVPSEANVGDLAIIWHYVNSSSPTISLPTGWTSLHTVTNATGKLRAAWKILTQADINTILEVSINQTGKKWIAFMATYSGVNTASPINVSSTFTETAYQTGHSAPAVTTTVANCWIVRGVFDTSTTNSSWTVPVSDTFREARYGVAGNAATGVIADAGPKALGAVAAASYSANHASKWANADTIAIAPATGTGPGSVNVWMGALQFEQAASASTWTAAGTWLSLFTGFVDTWAKTFEDTLSIMQVSATDKSKHLSSINIGSAVYETITGASPVAYYMLNESGDSATTQGANSALTQQSTMKSLQVGTGGTLEWGSGIGPPVDGVAAAVVTKQDINNGLVMKTDLLNPIHGASAFSVACWFTTKDTDASSTTTVIKATTKNSGGAELAYGEIRGTSGTNMSASGAVKSGNLSFTSTATDSHNYYDNRTHLAVATFELTGDQLVSTLFIDGVQTAQNSVASTISEFPVITTLAVANSYPTKHLLSGTFSHAAVFDYVVDSDTIAEIYTAGKTAFAGDTVDQRIARICHWAGVNDTDLDPSDIICDRHMPDTKSAQDVIRQAAKTDGGTVFINGSGKIEFKSRLVKESTYTAWLNVDTRYVQTDMAWVTDDQLLVNQAVVNQVSTGASATSFNLDSQDVHGTYERDNDSLAQDIQEAQNAADYYTAFYAFPTQRCDNVTVEATFLNNWPTIVKQDMWNIIHLTSLPSIESSSTLDLYVEGWGWHFTDESVVITYDTSAAIPFAVLNDPSRGVVGTTNVVAW